MIVKYRIVSAESDKFVRDIEIYADNSFLDLHMAIQEACEYDSSMLTTFFHSNNNWDKKQEIILEKIDPESQADTLLMKDTKLSDLPIDIGEKYIYIFDFFSVRSFFITIVNIRKPDAEDKNLEYPICTLSKGKAPEQFYVDDIDNMEIDDLSDDFDNDSDFSNIDDYDL